MTMQQSIIPLYFYQGERVEVVESAPGNITGFGRIECAVNARPGWYYVRFPQGELALVQWVYIGKAAQ
jgi:hypothetical protein